jgi:hypothetical protein
LRFFDACRRPDGNSRIEREALLSWLKHYPTLWTKLSV